MTITKENISPIISHLPYKDLRTLKVACPAFFNYMAANHLESNVVTKQLFSSAQTFPFYSSPILSPDGSVLASVGNACWLDSSPYNHRYFLFLSNPKTNAPQYDWLPPYIDFTGLKTHYLPPVFSPDGRYVVAVGIDTYSTGSSPNQLNMVAWSLQPNGFKQFYAGIINVTAPFSELFSVNFLDDTRLCIESNKQFIIAAINPANKTIPTKEHFKSYDGYCIFSPDRSTVAHIDRSEENKSLIYIDNSSSDFGFMQRRWDKRDHQIVNACFSPDNQRIAMLSSHDKGSILYLLDSHSGADIKVTPFPKEIKQFAFLDKNLLLLHTERQLHIFNLITNHSSLLFTGDNFHLDSLGNKMRVVVHQTDDANKGKFFKVFELTSSRLREKFAAKSVEFSPAVPKKRHSI